MYHDRSLAAQAQADPRPASAVSTGAGLAGLAGIVGWVCIARALGMDGPYAALIELVACAVPMIAWSLVVDRVHRSATTGIDWAARRSVADTLDVSITKLAGLWATWLGIAAIYMTCRFYWQGGFSFAMWCFAYAAPVMVALSVPYVIWLDRHLIEPKDGAWHLGAWLTGQAGVEHEAIYGHLRNWGVKAFFLAFMLAGLPGGFGSFVRWDWRGALGDPAGLAQWLITFMFVVDMGMATVGYILTLRPLDSHIRSANPYAAAWMAALICYPPTIMMDAGGPLDYHIGTQEWSVWFAGHPKLLALWGAILVVLTGIYAWATVAFGPRFSNLTNRGILTHGPYAFSRHPAYLSKNLFWWLATIPILTTGSPVDATRATLTLAAVSGVYYWRAKTEERHLRLDPDYVAYDAWMARRGLVPRLFQRWGWAKR
jgi:protein-S-isoprenylcysteine O-methyltransferase Ste14